MEQGTGIEPAFTAWEAVVLPIYEPCGYEGIIAETNSDFNLFLSEWDIVFAAVGKKRAVDDRPTNALQDFL